MKRKALDHFIEELSNIWGPLTSELTLQSKVLLEELMKASKQETWMEELKEQKLPFKEIYRSDKHGFVLMGHVEKRGDQSPPHDHGSGWVIYGTVEGQSKMGLYNRVFYPDGSMQVVQKDAYVLKAGECSVYLPGDIHDTFTLEENTVMLRLTSCDFLQELNEGRLVRYANTATHW